MPHTCENCEHWRKIDASNRTIGIAVNIGECRCNPPTSSHNWPRTHGTEYCSCHSAAALRLAQAQPLPPKSEYAEPKSAKPTKARRAGELPL